jgi:hypothetical protein
MLVMQQSGAGSGFMIFMQGADLANRKASMLPACECIVNYMLPMRAGYKQELNRDFNLFTNSAISFSIISILTGITSERISLCQCRLPACCCQIAPSAKPVLLSWGPFVADLNAGHNKNHTGKMPTVTCKYGVQALLGSPSIMVVQWLLSGDGSGWPS